ncbi:glycosyltransferase family 4 protein [Akkermansiaceae bacterium]|nr:glycosyltransferase family 4 protein [Akkermansiaceae bacterium]
MKILWDLLGDASKASSRVRGYWIHDELTKLGVDSAITHGDSRIDLIRFGLRMLLVDVVVFQKKYSRWHVLLAKWGRLLGKTVILDIDDAPSRSQNASTLRNVEKMMSICSVVICGCQKLVDYAGKYSEHVVLIPSCIKLNDYYSVEDEESDSRITLGWIGNGAHYCKDLVAILAEPLRLVAETQPIRFRIVGACGQQELRDAFGNIPNLDLELIDQIDWAADGATRDAMKGVDIGLYPLLKNNFNPYKCGFKALEYMALGIPVSASPVSVSADIVRKGVDGFLCHDSADWVQAIEKLIDNESLRSKMGASARDRVEQNFSTRAAAKHLLAELNQETGNL